MLNRVNCHIKSLIPTLKHNKIMHDIRVVRMNTLNNEQKIFITDFLKNNIYYYNTQISCYYEYLNNDYIQIKYDDILYKLLTTIRHNNKLICWKYKTQYEIIKRIKQKNIYNCIPSIETQDTLLKIIVPSLFNTKNNAMYFLTIIGDIIKKKKFNIKFLISKKTKQIVNNLLHMIHNTIGISNIDKSFITKYHSNHNFTNYRLFTTGTKRNIFNYNTFNIVNFICVSCYYSDIYNNSDNYMMNNSNNNFKKYTLFLTTKNHRQIVYNFCKKYFVKTGNCECKLKWINIYKLWKKYLLSLKLYHIIYIYDLKQEISNFFDYDKSSDIFLNMVIK
jgi:hypothetical protein